MRDEVAPGTATRRRPHGPRTLPVRAMRGALTLEQRTLPAVIVASFVALGIIQLILTW